MDTLEQNLEYKNHNHSFLKIDFVAITKLEKEFEKKYRLLKIITW